MNDILHHLRADHLTGRRGGLYAVCSARREVLDSAIALARDHGRPLLVEATANQVNQFGGYTGMTPQTFASSLGAMAAAMGFPRENLLLGADHLGPYAWRKEPAATAMAKAAELARRCVEAGFHKLHLDAAFGCSDDPPQGLPLEIAAERTATLCQAAETAAERLPDRRQRPYYVIGAEVPVPGGALENPEDIQVTRPEDVAEFIALAASRFQKAALSGAWEQRLLAVIVQPGVEFGNLSVARYVPAQALALSAFHRNLPGIMTYEIHSTDYQTPESLARMVADHFTLLKVGPCLTHAFREAVFALEQIETERLKSKRDAVPSDLRRVMGQLMLQHPVHWRSHYRGIEEECRRMCLSSRLDRIRYYWGYPEAQAALDRLHRNLAPSVPAAMVEQYFTDHVSILSSGESALNAAEIIQRRIQTALQPYLSACR
jgi:D-tagatose-1,6-bisphosphate aldolase subunit GatZ/KbaZ